MINATRDERQRLLRLEGLLTALLRYGALVASGWIALGMAVSACNGVFPLVHTLAKLSDRCIAIGIVLLITLPVLRVALMTGVFWFEKDYRFAAISGVVLLIITLGFLVGAMHRIREQTDARDGHVRVHPTVRFGPQLSAVSVRRD
jgi:Protein of unknown function (DUF1634)